MTKYEQDQKDGSEYSAIKKLMFPNVWDESRFILQIIFCYNSGNTEKKWNAHDSEMLNIYIYMDNTIVLKY